MSIEHSLVSLRLRALLGRTLTNALLPFPNETIVCCQWSLGATPRATEKVIEGQLALPLYDFMKFDKLMGYMQANMLQETRGARRTLLEEGIDVRTPGGRILRPRMQMQALLSEFAPELFNAIPPGGIGRQLDYWDRQAGCLPLPPRLPLWVPGSHVEAF